MMNKLKAFEMFHLIAAYLCLGCFFALIVFTFVMPNPNEIVEIERVSLAVPLTLIFGLLSLLLFTQRQVFKLRRKDEP